MKRLPYLLNLLICFSIFFPGCSKKIDLALPPHNPELVLNGVFNPDTVFMVDLSSSNPMSSDQDFSSVTNASVKLFQNGNYLADLIHSKDGIYRAQINPQPLQKYEIKAAAPGFPDISASSHVPSPPIIEQVKASVANPSDRTHSDKEVNVSMKLKDVSAEENFYFVRAYANAIDYSGHPYTKIVYLSFISPDEHDFRREVRYFFSDKLLKTESSKLILHLENSPDETTYIQIARVTEEYYRYGKTFDKHHSPDFNLHKTGVFNNIQNGLGIFAGYNAITLEVKP